MRRGDEAADPAREQTEPPGIGGLLAGLEEELEAEADAHDRAAGAATSRTASPRPVLARFREPCPKLPTPGTSTRSARRTSSGSVVSVAWWPARLERAHHALQVVDAVVHHRDHRVPLVDGTPATRGSSAVAASSARAKALKAASTMWCGLSPRTRSRCAVSPALSTSARKNSGREEDVVVAQHLPLGDLDVVVQVRPAGDVHHRAHQRLVQRHHRVAVAADAGAVAQRLGDRRAERDAGVLDRVVAVHVEIALRLDGEVQQAVARQRLEHVVEEADAGLDLRLAPPVEVDPDEEIGLLGRPADLADARCHRGLRSRRRESRLKARQHRVHVLLGPDRDPETFGQLGTAGDVAHQDAVLVVEPPEHLGGGPGPAAEQHEVGRGRDRP